MSVASQIHARWDLFHSNHFAPKSREEWDAQMSQAFQSMQKDLGIDEADIEIMAGIGGDVADHVFDVARSPFLTRKQVALGMTNAAFIGFVIGLDIGKNTDAIITAFKGTEAYKTAQGSVDAEQPSDRERREHRSGHKG